MICVYILKSQKDGNRYIGSTSNLEKRIKEHESGKVFSTRNRRPLKVIYYQECSTLVEARLFESKYKKSRGSYDRAIKKGLLITFGV